MSTKVEWMLGATPDQVESKPSTRPVSRSSSRNLRSTRASFSRRDIGRDPEEPREPRGRMGNVKLLLMPSNDRGLTRLQANDTAMQAKPRSSYASAGPLAAQNAGATRRPSPKRQSAAFNWPLPVLPSKSRGSWMLNHSSHAAGLQQSKSQAQDNPPSTMTSTHAFGPTQHAQRKTIRSHLSKLSLRSRKSSETVTNSAAPRAMTDTPSEDNPLPYPQFEERLASSQNSAVQSLRHVQLSQEPAANPQPSKRKPRKAKAKPKFWWDTFDEDVDKVDDLHPDLHPEEVLEPRPETPAESTYAPHHSSPFSRASQLEPRSTRDDDMDTLRGLLPVHEYAHPSYDENYLHVSSPQNMSSSASNPQSSRNTQPDTNHSKVVLRSESKCTMRSSIHQGSSVLSLSDSEDSDVELADPTKFSTLSSNPSPKQPPKGSRARGLHQPSKRFPKPFNPDSFRKAALPDLNETFAVDTPGTSSTEPSSYLADSSDESSESQTTPSSPAMGDINGSTRSSWISNSPTFFPAPPSRLRTTAPLPFKHSPLVPHHSKRAAFRPIPSLHGAKRLSEQSRPTSHHIMTVTAEEAMLLSSMRKKRASMHQQLFSEGYKTALQEELRIMEHLRVEELSSTPSADGSRNGLASARSSAVHSAPAEPVPTPREPELSQRPDMKRAVSTGTLEKPHVFGTVAAELAALDQQIEAEAEAEAKARAERSRSCSSAPPSSRRKPNHDTFVLQSSSEETIVLANTAEEARSPTPESLLQQFSSRDFAEQQPSSSSVAGSSVSNSVEEVDPAPAGLTAAEGDEQDLPQAHYVAQPTVSKPSQFTRRPSRSKSAARHRSSKIPRSVPNQREPSQPQRPSSRPSSGVSSEQNRLSRSSVARDVMAAWDELGGTRYFEAISSTA